MTITALSTVDLLLDGHEPGPGAGRLLALRVVSRLGLPTQCELTLAAGGGEPWPSAWKLGTALTVWVRGDDGPLFAGDVTGVEVLRSGGPAGCRVRAYDRLHRLRRQHTPRVLTDATAVDVAEAVAGGLTVVAARPGPRLDRVVQHGQSDLDLLTEVAAGAGLYPLVRGETLHLATLAGIGPPVPLTWGATLWDAQIESNEDGTAATVTAIGWHPQRAEILTGRANGGGAGGGEAIILDRPARSQDGVTALAQAEWEARAARATTLRGTAAGSARLRAGTPVRIDGLGEGATFVLTTATHTMDGAGYQTTFSTEPPRPAAPLPSSAITLGRITAVDDPDGLGRVRVSLPALGDLDVGWLGVLCPGAGPGRGLVLLPDVGDLVMVALPQGSPAAGVVLGAVFGVNAPPDPGVSGGAVKRWTLRTADGQSIVVDDDEHSVRISNRGGSYVELTPDTLRLHASSDLVIEAPGHAMTIRAASVDFEHAPLPL